MFTLSIPLYFYMHYVHDIIQSEISDAFIRSTNNKHTPRYKDMWRKESCNILLIQLLHNINDKIIRSFLLRLCVN